MGKGITIDFMPRSMADHRNITGYDRCIPHHPTWEPNPPVPLPASELRGESRHGVYQYLPVIVSCQALRGVFIFSATCTSRAAEEEKRGWNLKRGTCQNPLLQALLRDATVVASRWMLHRECRAQPKHEHDMCWHTPSRCLQRWPQRIHTR